MPQTGHIFSCGVPSIAPLVNSTLPTWPLLFRGPTVPPKSHLVRQRQQGPGGQQLSFAQSVRQCGPHPRPTLSELVRLHGTSRFQCFHQGVQIRAMYCSTQSRRHRRVSKRAQAQTVFPHLAKLVEDCQGYCARATRRLEKVRDAVQAVQEVVVKFEQEVQEGQQRLEELSAAALPPLVMHVSTDLPPTMSDLVAEVNQLRAVVQELTRDRDSLRAGCPQGGEGQPTQSVLVLVPAENRNASNVMATLIEELDADFWRSQGRFAPY